MSVADVFHVSIFPEDFPVNIANPHDLRALRQAFPGRSVSIVVGSDVVLHASSYKKPVTPDSIHTFDHVVFRRTEPDAEPADYSCITGRVVELTLPPQLEEISSTRIREAVDANRDISNLIDPAVQEFIYRRGLYLREPQDKPVLRTEDLSFLPASPETAEKFLRTMLSVPTAAALRAQLEQHGDDIMVCRDADGAILGAAAYVCLDSAHLFARLGDPALSGLVRQNAGGRTLLISGLFVPRGERQNDLCQLLITEVLTLALSREFTYALYVPLEGAASGYGRQLLLLQGFLPASEDGDALAVDMRCPIVLSRNVDTAVKAPFSSSPRVLSAIANAHRRLQAALTKLQPGSLVLSLSAGVIYHRLLQRITGRNGVPAEPTNPRVLGPDICVPYGKILRGVAVPNTVTKTLRTDKVYEPDLSSYSIEAYPDYSPLAGPGADHPRLRPAGDSGGRHAPRRQAHPPPCPALCRNRHPRGSGAGGLSHRHGARPHGAAGLQCGRHLLPAQSAPSLRGIHPLSLHRRRYRPPRPAPARRPAALRQPHPALRRPGVRRYGRQDRLGAVPLLP